MLTVGGVIFHGGIFGNTPVPAEIAAMADQSGLTYDRTARVRVGRAGTAYVSGTYIYSRAGEETQISWVKWRNGGTQIITLARVKGGVRTVEFDRAATLLAK